MGKIDEITELAARLAGDAPPVAGYLTYNPGPGIYSRMERAVEALPENVRVQELPGLLKRYKDGIPGWELKAVDLDSLTAGRDVIPRAEILAAVKERSPVYTHREVVLGGRPQVDRQFEDRTGKVFPDYQPSPSPLGRGVSHGEAAFERVGQRGDNYGELVVLSPEARRAGWGRRPHHFHQDYPAMRGRVQSPEVSSGLTNEGVAHARFDEHDGALRVNEVQSDLGIHNRKAREATEGFIEGGGAADYAPREELPFPLEDVSMELLTKRLALYAAQNNLRRIEIASPQSIVDSLNMAPDRARHVYDKLLPSHWERLGRKMGGLTPAPLHRGPEPVAGGYDVFGMGARVQREFDNIAANADNLVGTIAPLDKLPSFGLVDDLQAAMRNGENPIPYAERLQRHLVTQAIENGWPESAAEVLVNQAMPKIMRQTEDFVNTASQSDAVAKLAKERGAASGFLPAMPAPPSPGRAYEMSEEMFRRILQQGIPAAIAIGIGTDAVLDRLGKEAPQPQMR